MAYRLRSSWLSIVALLLLLPLGACKSNGSSSSSAQEDSENTETSAVEPQEEGEEGEQAQNAPPTDLYPGMNFGSLNPQERTKFVEIAKAEVCPCPDAAESLHECLQDQAKACALAKQVAGLAASGVRQGRSETDVLNRIAEFVEAAQKQHEFTLEGVPHKGPKEAPVSIVEFADFQCPHCKTASGIMKQITEKYGDDVVVYFKQFPLQSHSHSELAARAALAAQEQGKFWQMHDLLFENQHSLSEDKITTFARRLALNMNKFTNDLNSQEIAAKVARDREEGNQAGITGTPALFIDGRRYAGPLSPAALSQTIDAKLEEAKKAEQEQ